MSDEKYIGENTGIRVGVVISLLAIAFWSGLAWMSLKETQEDVSELKALVISQSSNHVTRAEAIYWLQAFDEANKDVKVPLLPSPITP